MRKTSNPRSLFPLLAVCTLVVLLPQTVAAGEPQAPAPAQPPGPECREIPQELMLQGNELYEVVSAKRIILKPGVEVQEMTNDQGVSSLLLTYESEAEGVVAEAIDCNCIIDSCPKVFCRIEKDGPFGRVCIGDCLNNNNTWCSNCMWEDGTN